jgi:hypothetical protein
MRSLLGPLAALAALAAAPAGAEPPRVAVVALDAPPELRFTARSVAEAVAKEAARTGAEVVGPAEAEAALGPGAHRELVRCADDARCLAERGARLGVERIVAGFLRKRGASYRVGLVHVDARTGERLGAVEREVPIASRRLHADAAAAAPGLLAGGTDATGVLRVATDVPGAEVTVDGVVVGRTPLERAVTPGRHEVKVAQEGFADAAPSFVDVPARAVVEHRPRMHRIPARERPNASPTEGQGTAVQVVR